MNNRERCKTLVGYDTLRDDEAKVAVLLLGLSAGAIGAALKSSADDSRAKCEQAEAAAQAESRTNRLS